MADESPINKFFWVYPPEPRPPLPPRVYARTIARGEEGAGHVLFDAVESSHFDAAAPSTGDGLSDSDWRTRLLQLDVFAVEVTATDPQQTDAQRANATDWLKANRESVPDWVELRLSPDPTGPAMLYDHVRSPGTPVSLAVEGISKATRSALDRATSTKAYERSDDEIQAMLPAGTIDHVIVLDVGQGAANVLADVAGTAIAYVDLGGGVLADRNTWNPAMTLPCLGQTPPIILTHWHYDHFDGANRFPAARSHDWIAPQQTLGPGPQSVFASALISSRKLSVWAGSGTIRRGDVELECCIHHGTKVDRNRTGLAVWVHGPAGRPPILIPGDAGYKDIPSLPRAITALVASHHGGQAPGTPPGRPGTTKPRLALSYGPGNSYTHPLAPPLARLRGAGFMIGHPGSSLDDLRTEDRGGSLGHIGLAWTHGTTPPSCPCGCTGAARQW